jgi:hypothetical protein
MVGPWSRTSEEQAPSPLSGRASLAIQERPYWFPASAPTTGRHSPRTRIHYFADGEREETPMFGLDHFNSYTPLPVNIPVHFEDLGGAYLFHDLETTYWERIDEFRGKFSSPILWEISAGACRPENRDAVLERLPLVDVLSINEAEAFSLLAVNALPDVVAALRGASVMVLLRLGARGSIVLGGGRPVRIGTAPTHAADPTGGGNAYSGAFLTSFAQTGDHAAAGTVAAAAASVVVANPGSPKVTTAIRSAVQHAATKVSVVPILD